MEITSSVSLSFPNMINLSSVCFSRNCLTVGRSEELRQEYKKIMKVPLNLGRCVCRLCNIHGATMGHMPVTHITHRVHTSHSQFKSKHKVTLQTGGSSVTDTHSVCTVYVSIYCVSFKQSYKQETCMQWISGAE